jgi:hypothetical protein
MDIDFQIRKSGFIPGMRGWKRILNGLVVASLIEALHLWRRTIRPKHFENTASTRYGYTPRKGERGSGRPFKGSYTEQKLKQKGHTRPLEFSGDLKRLSEFVRVAAHRTKGEEYPGARMTLVKANKANLRHPKSKINMREELTRIIPAEERDMVRTADQRLGVLLKGAKGEG